MVVNSPPDDWNQWSRHVLAELKRLNGELSALSKEIGLLKTEVAMLRVKAGLWGAAGASVPIILMIILERLP